MAKETALHFAVATGNLEIIQYLVEEGKCDTLAKNNYQSNPLGKLCAKYFANMENKLECVKYLLSKTFEEVPNREGLYAIGDIFEPAMLNLFSPRRYAEMEDDVTQYFLDTFYSKKYNQKHAIIEKLSGPIWKYCLFFHDDIKHINDFIPPGLRTILTFSKELNQILYSYILVTFSFDETAVDLVLDILEEIFKIGLREYLEKDIFGSLLIELYFMKANPSIVLLTKKLLELKEDIDINALYCKLLRRLALTKSMDKLDNINPLILPFCTFTSIENTVVLKPINSIDSLKSLCRKVLRFLILRKNADSPINFCNSIMSINDLPMSLRLYLRFIENNYTFWIKYLH